MTSRTYGCLSIRCRHEFTTDEEPQWHQNNIAGGPPCPKCSARTKWIPGLTYISCTAPEKPKSDFRLKNEILDKAVKQYNDRQELSGLKIGDVKPERGQPTIRQKTGAGQQTIPWTFRDASGAAWNTQLPVGSDGGIVQGNSWPVRADTHEKLKGKDDRIKKPWVPKQQ